MPFFEEYEAAERAAALGSGSQNDTAGVCQFCGFADDDILLGVCSGCAVRDLSRPFDDPVDTP